MANPAAGSAVGSAAAATAAGGSSSSSSSSSRGSSSRGSSSRGSNGCRGSEGSRSRGCIICRNIKTTEASRHRCEVLICRLNRSSPVRRQKASTDLSDAEGLWRRGIDDDEEEGRGQWRLGGAVTAEAEASSFPAKDSFRIDIHRPIFPIKRQLVTHGATVRRCRPGRSFAPAPVRPSPMPTSPSRRAGRKQRAAAEPRRVKRGESGVGGFSDSTRD